MSGVAGLLIRPWYDERWIANLATQFGLVPLVWCGWLAWRRMMMDAAWWWLSVALALSWLADVPIDFIPHYADWVPSLVYLVGQTTLIGAVLMPKRSQSVALLAFLTAAAVMVTVAFGAEHPDAVLHGVAWTSVVLIVFMQPDLPIRLRAALLVLFGMRILTWTARVRWPSIPLWYVDQSVRLIGLLLFCWAAVEQPERSLRLVA